VGLGAGRVNLVADVAGHYFSETLHTIQGGVRIGARRTTRVRPFFQIVAGVGRLTRGSGRPESGFAIQPGFGVDIPFRPGGPGVRVRADLLGAAIGDGCCGVRLTVGVVIAVR